MYKVGGLVRDQILGIQSKDIDYAVEAESYQVMKDTLLKMGVTIFVENPEFVTIRGKFQGEGVDFVLCRKDGYYSDGRRPDEVQIGTLHDDLARRDFTMNAIAIDIETGLFIDPFNGVRDIGNRVIKCVGSEDRLREDSLRMLRALRFAVTKGFTLDFAIEKVIRKEYQLLSKISRERIYEELKRMMDFNATEAFAIMNEYQEVFDFIFDNCNVGLTATLPHIKENKK